MPANRFFIDAPFVMGEEVALEGEEHHHLSRVIRCEKGDSVECVNGRGELAQAEITAVEKKETRLVVRHIEKREKPKTLILAQALPRFNRLEWILEKGTELGATEFWLFPSSRSEKTTLSAQQQERARALLIAAMKQCGRLDLPEIHLRASMQECPFSEGVCVFGDVRDHAPMIRPSSDPICLFIGPESGFTDEEVTYLENKIGARGVRLHENILRVDTAAIVALFTARHITG